MTTFRNLIGVPIVILSQDGETVTVYPVCKGHPPVASHVMEVETRHPNVAGLWQRIDGPLPVENNEDDVVYIVPKGVAETAGPRHDLVYPDKPVATPETVSVKIYERLVQLV